MGNATLVIDGHVHLYPNYDLIKAVEKGVTNLKSHATKYIKENSTIVSIWLLAERSDSDFFKKIYDSPKSFSNDEIRFKKGKDKLTVVVEQSNQVVLYIFAGRQLITREGLEVLSLISDLNIIDRQKAIEEIIQDVKGSGGIPALNWAPGKWFFARGKVIARQIQQKSPDDFFIGETTLRHTLWQEPKLIKQARNKGFQVIAGSDPLPFKGEENGIGCYGFLISGTFDQDNPAQSLRALMNSHGIEIKIIGNRNNVLTFARRQYKIMMEKTTRS